jgi:hypothetical protein
MNKTVPENEAQITQRCEEARKRNSAPAPPNAMSKSMFSLVTVPIEVANVVFRRYSSAPKTATGIEGEYSPERS